VRRAYQWGDYVLAAGLCRPPSNNVCAGIILGRRQAVKQTIITAFIKSRDSPTQSGLLARDGEGRMVTAAFIVILPLQEQP